MDSEWKQLLETIQKQGKEWFLVRENLELLRDEFKQQNAAFKNRNYCETNMVIADALELLILNKIEKDSSTLRDIAGWINIVNENIAKNTNHLAKVDAFSSFLEILRMTITDLPSMCVQLLQLLEEQSRWKQVLYALEIKQEKNLLRDLILMKGECVLGHDAKTPI